MYRYIVAAPSQLIFLKTQSHIYTALVSLLSMSMTLGNHMICDFKSVRKLGIIYIFQHFHNRTEHMLRAGGNPKLYSFKCLSYM